MCIVEEVQILLKILYERVFEEPRRFGGVWNLRDVLQERIEKAFEEGADLVMIDRLEELLGSDLSLSSRSKSPRC